MVHTPWFVWTNWTLIVLSKILIYILPLNNSCKLPKSSPNYSPMHNTLKGLKHLKTLLSQISIPQTLYEAISHFYRATSNNTYPAHTFWCLHHPTKKEVIVINWIFFLDTMNAVIIWHPPSWTSTSFKEETRKHPQAQPSQITSLQHIHNDKDSTRSPYTKTTKKLLEPWQATQINHSKALALARITMHLEINI